jgi:hypothetical protein
MFVVECKSDEALVTSLASVSRRRVDHVYGRSRVLRKLVRNYENSVEVVDEDPDRAHSHDIQRFREIDYLERDRLRILHHNQRNNRLLVLCPRLEEWIIEASREANIDLRRYNLPNDPDELHEIINIRIERFQRLLKELMRRSRRVRALRNRLRE